MAPPISYRNDFSYFYPQITPGPILSTESRVKWPFGAGEEAKTIF